MEVQKFERLLPKRREISVMGNLNDDLLVEVLVRLPCKYVIRFKCVCKRWMSLISNPRFMHYFLDHHQRTSISSSSSSSLLLSSKSKKELPREQCWSFIALVPFGRGWRDKKEVRFLAGHGCEVELPLFKPGLPFLLKGYCDGTEQKPRKVSVVGCFNDLILCSIGFTKVSVYYICNPLTMQFLALPPPLHVHERVVIGFVCEPLSMYPNNRFRVVRNAVDNCTPYFPLSPELEIFSSETGLWSKKTLAVSYPTGMASDFYNASKLVSYENGQMVLVTWKYIIHFDPFAGGSKIKGQFINMPDGFCSSCVEYGTDLSVVISQGRLFLLKIYVCYDDINIVNTPQIKVWKESNDKSEWMLVHQVQFKEMKAIQECVVTPLVTRITAEELKRMYTRRASPHSKQHRRTWLGNFLKGLERCFYLVGPHKPTHQVIFVGFDLNHPFRMYLILCPPEPALAACAAYNMRTRAIKLLPESKVPLHLRCLTVSHSIAIRNQYIFPFVVQPWPTPLSRPSL